MTTARPLLMIPGPIELHESVRTALAQPTLNHVDPELISNMSYCLKSMREVFRSPKGQPFLLTASGSFGWEVAASNLVRPGDNVAVISTGFFGDRLALCLEAHSLHVHRFNTVPGTHPADQEIVDFLSRVPRCRMVTLTHVDTSTAVLLNLKRLSLIIQRVAPDALIMVDGVCSVGAEDLEMDNWGLDFVVTCSQKALGGPCGLCPIMVSPRALTRALAHPPSAYYASLSHWLPIMTAYENCSPSYFATPACQAIMALAKSFQFILKDGIVSYQQKHKMTRKRIQTVLSAMQLSEIPDREFSSNALSAICLPKNITNAQLLPLVRSKGAILASGLHPDLKTTYFRVGHMGVSAVEPERKHIEVTFSALEGALIELGYPIQKGTALSALKSFSSKL